MAVAASRPPGSEGKVLKFDSRFAAEGDDAFGHTFGVKVDGASPRGLWPPDGGGLYSLRSGGDSGSAAEGGGGGFAAIFKVSVTGLSPALIVILTPGEEFWYM